MTQFNIAWLSIQHINQRLKLITDILNLTLTGELWGVYCEDFIDTIFRCIFVNKNFCILIKISLKFVPGDPIDNNPSLV